MVTTKPYTFYTTLSLRLLPEEYEWLRQQALKRQCSMQVLLRELMRRERERDAAHT